MFKLYYVLKKKKKKKNLFSVHGLFIVRSGIDFQPLKKRGGMCSSNIVYYKKQQQKDTEEFIAGNHALKEADSEENFDAQYLSTQISST